MRSTSLASALAISIEAIAPSAWAQERAPMVAIDDARTFDEHLENAATILPPTLGPVVVRLESPRPATLEQREGPNAPWRVVCIAPCEVHLPLIDSYRIVGDGLNPSRAFMLANGRRRLVLHVDPGSRAEYLTGAWLLGGGAMLVAIGAAVIIVGAQPSLAFKDGSFVAGTGVGWLIAGVTVVAAGAVGAVVGASLAFGNAQTRVTGDVAVLSSNKPPASLDEFTLGRPVTERSVEGAALARVPAVVTPLVTWRF